MNRKSFGTNGANNLPQQLSVPFTGGKWLIMSDPPGSVFTGFDCCGVSEFTLWATLIMCLIVLC